MSLPPEADPSSVVAIRRLEWEPDEQLSSRTWAYTALVAGRPVAVQAIVFRADRSLLYLTPDLKREAIPADLPVARLLQVLADRIQHDLADLDIVFQQAVVEPGDEVADLALAAAGFQPLTDVCELSRPIDGETLADAGTTGAAIDLVAPSFESPLWKQAFEASLAGGLDVPELLERRGAGESFESLRLLAGEETDHWRIALWRNEPVGLVLPTPLPDGTAEIQYMGVALPHRRRGIGRQLVADAIEAAADLGASALLVHVDARNLPALRLYESQGFQLVSRRNLRIR